MRIALVEENAHDAEMVCGWLRSAGHTTLVYESGKRFVRDSVRETYHLLIVGTCAPDAGGMDGTEVLWWAREHLCAPVPILRVSEHNSEYDIVAALKAGADDCMVKPVRQGEFLARAEALSRRLPHVAKPVETLRFGDLSVDLKNRMITRDTERIFLTPKSYDLAIFLLSNLGQLLSRAHLMERIWGRGASTSSRTLDTHISRLRTDLGLTPEKGWQLQSVYQHGYRLEQTESLAATA